MIRLLQNNSPLLGLLLIPVSILLNLQLFDISGTYPVETSDFFSSIIIKSFLSLEIHFIPATVLLLTILLQAMIIVNMSNIFGINGLKNFLPGFIYIFFISGYSDFFNLSIVLFSNFFIIGGLFLIFRTVKKENAIFDFMNVGIMFSLAALINPDAFYLILLVWFSIIVIRPMIWNEWVGSFLGFILPFILIIFISFIFTENLSIFSRFYEHCFSSHEVKFEFSLSETLYFIVSAGFILFSIIGVANKFSKIKISQRRIMIILISFVVFIAFIAKFSPASTFETWLLLGLPGSIIFSTFINLSTKKTGIEIIFDIFLILLIFSKTGLKIPYLE